MKRGLYFLSQLDDLDVDWLISAGRSEDLPAGTTIIGKGHVKGDLILILDGTVRVFDPGTARQIAELERGELLGEVSFVDQRGATAAVETVSDTKIFRLPNKRVEEKLARDSVFSGRFYAMIAGFLSGRLRGLLDQSEPNTGQPGESQNEEQSAAYSLAIARLGRLLNRLNPDATVVIAGQDLSIEDLVKVARRGNRVVLSDVARLRVEQSRQVVDELAASDRRIYGLNTGLGALRDATISPTEMAQFQRNILLSHAAGSPPPYARDVVRAIMLARLNGMARGGTGISPHIFDRLMEFLNEDIIPIVPSRGSVGMSDLAPLAHMSLPLIGEGDVDYRGVTMSAGEALQKAGLEPVALAAKDGLSLVSANSAAIGHGGLVLARLIDLLVHADIAAAMSIEAFEANPSPLDERLLTVRPHQGQIMTTMRLRALLRRPPSAPQRKIRNLQDPISFRCVPQVHGPFQEALATARRIVELELNATGDNPVVLPDVREIVSNGNFHPAGIALAFETLALSLSHVCSLSTSRTLRLNDPTMTGLPAQLTSHPGLNSGLGVLQKTVTMLNAQARFLASPASLDFMPIAGSIEDHSTMSTLVVSKCEAQVETAERIIAIEMLTAAQAIDLRDNHQLDPKAPLSLGVGTGAAFECLRRHVGFMTQDRILTSDAETICGLIRKGTLLQAAGEAAQLELGADGYAC